MTDRGWTEYEWNMTPGRPYDWANETGKPWTLELWSLIGDRHLVETQEFRSRRKARRYFHRYYGSEATPLFEVVAFDADGSPGRPSKVLA